MTNEKNTTIAVIGAGTMGAGIALVALRTNFNVILYDIVSSALEKGQAYIKKHLTRKGQEAALNNLSITTDLEQLGGAAIVIEAALENLTLKQELFGKLDTICPPPAILATNTSTLAVTAIAAASSSPERVAGMHFFNPAPVLPLVEVAQGAQSSPETIKTLVALAKKMGKTPVVTRDTPGFIVNRVARPFYAEALRLVGEGIATPKQVDQVLKFGGNFKMGPFELMDLIGIDINFTATQSMYQQTFHEPRYRPHWLQEKQVQQNALGRKTGKGFYTYNQGKATHTPTFPQLNPIPGKIAISQGEWGPGITELCEEAGYKISDEPKKKTTIAIVIEGKRKLLKKQLRKFDADLPPHIPILCQAVNTTVLEMATWLKHPQRLVGFDALFMSNGQAITLTTNPKLATKIKKIVESFITGLGYLSIWIQDTPALILPRVVCMLANEAAFAVGEGVAEAETVDLAMTLGVNYPKGPLTWAKEIGYNQVVAVLDHLYQEYHEERYRVAPLLRRLARLEKLTTL